MLTLNELLPFIGCSERNAELDRLLKSAGKGIAALSMRKLRSQGVEGIELRPQGLALTFNEREDYIQTYAEPKDEGEAILVAIFAYGAGGKTFQAYAGPIPYSAGPIVNREDALREFGAPLRTEIDEGVIEWDQWLKDGFQMRATYRVDGSLLRLSFTIPFK